MTDCELVGLLKKPLASVAKRLARVSGDDLQDADDLLQEGLIAALAARKRWRPEGGRCERDWCFIRGYGAMRDAKRKGSAALFFHGSRQHHATRIATSVYLSRLPPEVVEGVTSRQPAERRTTRAEFVRLVRKLIEDADPRLVDYLAAQHWEETTAEEVAARLGVSTSWLWVLQGRAVRKLKRRHTRSTAAELLGLS